jgi:lipopolysaccharide export system protein LptA
VDEKFVLAEKNVQFIDKENDVQLFGGSVTYDREKEIGIANIKPKLVKLDSLGNVDITIDALELSYNGKEKIATAKDSVKITQEDAVSYSNLATYFDNEDRIVIEGEPKVYQGNDRLSAERIELFLVEKQLDRAHLINNSEMLSQIMIEGRIATDKVNGKEIWIEIKNDSLRHIQVLEQATSYYHVIEDEEVQGVNQVMGDEIELIFEGGKVRFVNIRSKPGLSRGQFSPAGVAVKDLNWTK